MQAANLRTHVLPSLSFEGIEYCTQRVAHPFSVHETDRTRPRMLPTAETTRENMIALARSGAWGQE